MSIAWSRLASCRNRTARRLGHEDRGGEVVGLDPLPQEVGEVGRVGVAEREVAEGLEHDVPRVVAGRLLRQVDPAVLEVGDRAGRVRAGR